ncbi:MAG: phosphate/phosphite/phosphonate ABC transporter substrate-binding protein [Syntrophobacteraceae bacterium]|jgi:phosphonate transport system substrate-binding protein|nr:phosphate/phosphite/phosphonate ABC transporter substrate-binding protein [Syntrophobacteraceae bacterium]
MAILFLAAGPAYPASAGGPVSVDSSIPLIHVSFSSSMFAAVNENDVKAAMKVWAHVLFKERGLPINPEISVLNGIQEISSALHGRRFDAIALTTDEYWALEGQMQSDQVIVGLFDGQVTEEYLLLVHRESGIERLADLRGRSIVMFHNQRMSLAAAWLDTLLTREGLGTASGSFGRVTRFNKLPLVILPVFFRQSDACLVHRRGFQTMAELNPQVSQRLKVLAVSPEMMPAGFFFRGDWSHPTKERVLAEFEKIHMTPAGQQALTVFQSGHLMVYPISVLNSAFELIETHRRLSAAMRGPGDTEANPMSGKTAAQLKQ